MKRFKRHFGRNEWLALVGSLGIILLVSWFLARGYNFAGLGYAGGFLAMLLSGATLILPAPGLAVVAALGATVQSPLLLGVVAGVGAALGEVTGYLAGYGGHKIIEEQKYYRAIERFTQKYGFWAIVIIAFVPNPLFDIAGIIAGGTKYPPVLFLSATLIGKVAKCIIAAYAGTAAFHALFG